MKEMGKEMKPQRRQEGNKFFRLKFLGLIILLSCYFSHKKDEEEQKNIFFPTLNLANKKIEEKQDGNKKFNRRPFKCKDKGIFSDLDSQVRITLPPFINKDENSLLVDKKHRTISILWNGIPVMTYPIALGFSPLGTKERLGDGKTPEGELKIIEIDYGSHLPAKYGAAYFYLNYPRVEDAERGYKEGIINKEERDRIIEENKKGKIPPETKLGSSIRIHGGGAEGDWTLGCIAMDDEDILEILPYVKVGTKVMILSELPQKYDRDKDGIPDTVDALVGAHKVALNGAEYGGGYKKLKYPGGDLPRNKGVCTDVVVRAFRNAGYDLQVLVYEDMKNNPSVYNHKKPNSDIAHRRVKTLIKYFLHNFKDLGKDLFVHGQNHWVGGDIVFLDTFPDKPGPDHIGILSEKLNEQGYPLVINNWTDGYKESEMDLLPFVPITHRFRLSIP